MSAASFYENAALALDYAMGGHHWFPDATGAGVRNFRLHGVEDANASPEQPCKTPECLDSVRVTGVRIDHFFAPDREVRRRKNHRYIEMLKKEIAR